MLFTSVPSGPEDYVELQRFNWRMGKFMFSKDAKKLSIPKMSFFGIDDA